MPKRIPEDKKIEDIPNFTVWNILFVFYGKVNDVPEYETFENVC